VAEKLYDRVIELSMLELVDPWQRFALRHEMLENQTGAALRAPSGGLQHAIIPAFSV